MTTENAGDDATNQPRWQPIAAIDRRVLGVLVEKAKTTPDAYPLSLNGLVTGCNQKNNRHPVTQYEPDQIEESLDRLRKLGAVAAVHGSGRVGKYRHYMYEWLGVDKVELGVMAELLLRGPQTEGELRGRAARMDPIPDLSALRPIVDSLKAKGLLQSLTPEGRGQIVSHTLYLPEELEKVRRQIGEAVVTGASSTPAVAAARPAPRTASAAAGVSATVTAPAQTTSLRSAESASETAALRREIEELRAALAQLRSDVSDLGLQTQQTADALDRLRQSLGE